MKYGGFKTKVAWRIIRRAKTFNPNANHCMLYLSEKLDIAEYKGRDMVNKRTEIIAKCRHLRKIHSCSGRYHNSFYNDRFQY